MQINFSSSSVQILWVAYLNLLFVVRATELVQAVGDSLSGDSTSSKASKLLLGSIKQLKNARLKADPKLNDALVTIATNHPQLFTGNAIVEVRDSVGHFDKND